MFLVTLVVLFTDLVTLVFSVPAKATLNESAKRMAKHTIIPTLVEFFIIILLNIRHNCSHLDIKSPNNESLADTLPIKLQGDSLSFLALRCFMWVN